MKAVIEPGPPNLAQAVTEWQALAAECVTLADKLQGMRGQRDDMEAVLLATIPDRAGGVRAGGVVISEHRGRLLVEPDAPGIEVRLYERMAARRSATKRSPGQRAADVRPGDFTTVERRGDELVAR